MRVIAESVSRPYGDPSVGFYRSHLEEYWNRSYSDYTDLESNAGGLECRTLNADYELWIYITIKLLYFSVSNDNSLAACVIGNRDVAPNTANLLSVVPFL